MTATYAYNCIGRYTNTNAPGGSPYEWALTLECHTLLSAEQIGRQLVQNSTSTKASAGFAGVLKDCKWEISGSSSSSYSELRKALTEVSSEERTKKEVRTSSTLKVSVKVDGGCSTAVYQLVITAPGIYIATNSFFVQPECPKDESVVVAADFQLEDPWERRRSSSGSAAPGREQQCWWRRISIAARPTRRVPLQRCLGHE